MNGLTGLKLIAAQKPAQVSAVQQRRNKLIRRLDEQIELARAQATGTPFVAVRTRIVKDSETGQRTQVQDAKRVRAWWFDAGNGKLALVVRYGAHVLELGKGKWAVEVNSGAELVTTLEIIQAAVAAGALDEQLEASAGSLRKGFRK